jgi:hypothetical protein
VVKFKMQLPRYAEHAEPKVVHCADVNCRARVCDVGLPHRLAESGDVQIACPRCRRITHLLLEGVISIA